jgi:hypothetical protein
MANKRIPPDVLEFFREQGAKGGKLSAEARMRKLTPEQRSEIARKAVAAREVKRRAAKKSAVVNLQKSPRAT